MCFRTVGSVPFAGSAVDTDAPSSVYAGFSRSPVCVDHRPDRVHPGVGAQVLQDQRQYQSMYDF